MKKLLFSLLLGIFILGATGFSNLQASHYVGSDFSYAPVQGIPDAYVVTLQFYRDCGGMNPGNMTASIELITPGCGSTTNFSLPLISVQEVSEVCFAQSTECSNPPDNSVPGIQRYTYMGTIYLPGCTNFIFVYESDARNDGIINLNNGNSGSLNYYIHAQLTTFPDTMGVQTTNQTPTYQASPTPYFCVNDTVTYNPQVTDADGDSLVFSLSPALGLNGMPIVYTTGYTPTQPFGTSGTPLTLDPATGQIEFIPTQTGPFVIVLQVEEYRYIQGIPTLVGRTHRDIQVQVILCSTPCPMAGNIISVNGTGQSGTAAAQGMVNQPLQISIPASSTNPNVTLTMTSNCATEIPGSAFTVTGTGSSITGIFSWQPDSADARTAPYYFTYHVIDNACPFPNERYGVVQVNVAPDTTIVGLQQLHVSEFILPNLLQTGSPWVLPAGLANADVQIRDVTGRLVYNQPNYNNTFSGQGLSSGLYIYQITLRESGQVISGKMQLQR